MLLDDGFNPCFNGIRSPTLEAAALEAENAERFNPCFNGIRSPTQ